MAQEEARKEATGDFVGIDPTGKNPEEIELEWFENHYKGDVPQLTVRAVIMGMFLGGFMSLSNLYIGLKTGWGLGVAITACILSYSLGALLQKLRVLRGNLSIMENNCMQATASSAGYSTGGTMVSAIAALLMIEGHHLNFWVLFFWTIFLAMLGVVMTIPMKRQMINVEQLKFPSGVAGAETLRSLYAEGEAAKKKARSLFYAMFAGMGVAFVRDNGFSWYPEALRLPSYFQFMNDKIKILGHTLHEWTLDWENSAIMIAAGALIGIRTAWSMMLGGIVNFGLLAPWMYANGSIVTNAKGLLGYRQIVDWSLWIGASLMVTSGLLTFAFSWRTIGRAFSGLKDIFGGPKGPVNPRIEAMDKVEIPGTWFVIGMLVAGLGCVSLEIVAFSINWWMGILSVVLTFFLAIVACRATGETDITPIGAMGKITQLMYGILAPASGVPGGAAAAMKINLMTAGVTAGAAGSSADLLTVLKTGYLLGANPRKQFIAQFLGIFAGALVIVPAFYLLVPTADILGGDKFPAPAAQVWKGVAELLSQGLAVLSTTKRWGLVIGGFIGIILAILDKVVPAKYRKYYPSAMGLGLAFVIPFWNTFSMFVGAFIVWILEKKSPKWAEAYVIPIASGVIAGESLMGVGLNLATINPNEILTAIKGGAAATPQPAAILPTPDVTAILPTPTPMP
ncbi:MAG: OPT family oligopeptide transporter [Myxococcales bacterium]|nr:OPT family oligopeptide transporter [Myxococcales bacterium]